MAEDFLFLCKRARQWHINGPIHHRYIVRRQCYARGKVAHCSHDLSHGALRASSQASENNPCEPRGQNRCHQKGQHYAFSVRKSPPPDCIADATESAYSDCDPKRNPLRYRRLHIQFGMWLHSGHKTKNHESNGIPKCLAEHVTEDSVSECENSAGECSRENQGQHLGTSNP